MNWQVTIEPYGGGLIPAGLPRTFEPNRREIYFGRDASCDVVFPPEARMVGRRHCRLVLSPQGYWLEAFGNHYVEVNGQPPESAPMSAGISVIGFGARDGPAVRVLIAKGDIAWDFPAMPEAAAAPWDDRAHASSRTDLPDMPALPLSTDQLASAWRAAADHGGDGTGTPAQRPVPRVIPSPVATETIQAKYALPERRSYLPLLLGATIGLLIAGIGAWLLWRHAWGVSAGLVKLPHAAAPLPPGAAPEPAPPAEAVDVSAFAPALARPGETLLLQVFLHVPAEAAEVAEFARRSDSEAGMRGSATLAIDVPRGTVVTIAVEAGGRTLDEPVQRVTWRGKPHACQFLVTVPAEDTGGRFPVTMRVLIGDVPVGSLRFMQDVAATGQATNSAAARRGDNARRYRQAFLSYSSSDRAEVLKRAQALRAAHIAFFQDLLSLEPGDRWEHRLYEEIDRCDLFLLFWSSEAAKSEWVRKEAEYALGRRDASPDAVPQITPILLEGPPAPPPPDSLRNIHFNDPLLYVIAGEERGRA